MTDCLFICRRTPYGSGIAKANLDMILAATSFEQNIALLFIDQGTEQLRTPQQGKLIKQKDIAAALKALPLYEVERIFTDAEIDFAEPALSPKVLNNVEIKQLIAGSKTVVNL